MILTQKTYDYLSSSGTQTSSSKKWVAEVQPLERAYFPFFTTIDVSTKNKNKRILEVILGVQESGAARQAFPGQELHSFQGRCLPSFCLAGVDNSYGPEITVHFLSSFLLSSPPLPSSFPFLFFLTVFLCIFYSYLFWRKVLIYLF